MLNRKEGLSFSLSLSTQAKGRYYCASSHRSSKIDDNYLKELNEDLMLRKQELLEMLKPLEDKNNLLFQKLMSNLEEKQRRYGLLFWIPRGKKARELNLHRTGNNYLQILFYQLLKGLEIQL